MFRRAFFTLVFVAGSLSIGGLPAVTASADDSAANLACDDGTNVNLALDLPTLQDVTNSAAATVLYPAGLTCGVTQATDPNGSNGPQDIAVGGGQFINTYRGTFCHENFAVSAHSPDSEVPTTDAWGSAHLSVPNDPSCMFGAHPGGGNLVTKVDCLSVNGNVADFTAYVTQATGTFADEGIMEGQETSWEVKDFHSQVPPAPDEINVFPPSITPQVPCSFAAKSSPATFSVDHGQISVRDN